MHFLFISKKLKVFVESMSDHSPKLKANNSIFRKSRVILNRTRIYATQIDRFGFLNLEVKNGNPHTTLTGTFYDNNGDEIRDYFTIKKEKVTAK